MALRHPRAWVDVDDSARLRAADMLLVVSVVDTAKTHVDAAPLAIPGFGVWSLRCRVRRAAMEAAGVRALSATLVVHDVYPRQRLSDTVLSRDHVAKIPVTVSATPGGDDSDFDATLTPVAPLCQLLARPVQERLVRLSVTLHGDSATDGKRGVVAAVVTPDLRVDLENCVSRT